MPRSPALRAGTQKMSEPTFLHVLFEHWVDAAGGAGRSADTFVVYGRNAAQRGRPYGLSAAQQRHLPQTLKSASAAQAVEVAEARRRARFGGSAYRFLRERRPHDPLVRALDEYAAEYPSDALNLPLGVIGAAQLEAHDVVLRRRRDDACVPSACASSPRSCRATPARRATPPSTPTRRAAPTAANTCSASTRGTARSRSDDRCRCPGRRYAGARRHRARRAPRDARRRALRLVRNGAAPDARAVERRVPRAAGVDRRRAVGRGRAGRRGDGAGDAGLGRCIEEG